MVAILSLTSTIVLAAVAVTAQLPPSSGMPASCASGPCKAVNDKINAITNGGATCATDMTCFCTSDIMKGLADCYKCAATSTSGVDQNGIDDALKGFSESCKSAGYPVNISSITSSSNGVGTVKTGDACSLQISSFIAAITLGGLVLL